MGKSRVEQKNDITRRQVYHFLLGDPGMANYADKVIKKLEPDAIKDLKKWNRKFNEPYTDDEVRTLLYLSSIVDELWENQIKLRQTIERETQDHLSVFGHEDTVEDSRTTIRQKDEIYSKLYKSEHMQNAGPYARLKFAMDYWCALWFWPIEKAELLPSRSEFLFDLSVILEGTTHAMRASKDAASGQLSLFERSEKDTIAEKYAAITNTCVGEVDLDSLCRQSPRLMLVREIAGQNHFMHWELEFADLFAERGGFDLIIGNPPWVKVKWNEQSVLSDFNPLFTIHNFPADKKNHIRENMLADSNVFELYISEYVKEAGMLNYLSSISNYSELSGVQPNYYKCFLPQGWKMTNTNGVFAFIHPDGVFDDAKGCLLRSELYERLRKHFHFINEKLLFQEIGHPEVFGLNIYSNMVSKSFEVISNLFEPETIDQCYENISDGIVPGIKNENGEWNTLGNSDRIIEISKQELKIFAQIFDDSDDYRSARLPVVHAKQLLGVLDAFSRHSNLQSLNSKFFQPRCLMRLEHKKKD